MIWNEILYIFVGLGLIWLASGLVFKGIEKFSRDTKISTFATSFLILGILTSLTEISVGLNAVLDRKPSIFVGNLIGGSFVILLLIVPLLAIFSGGITLKHRLDQKRLLFFLVLIAAPSFLILDGAVSSSDAWILLVLYILFFNLFQSDNQILKKLDKNHNRTSQSVKGDVVKILIGAVLIFFAGKILVNSTIALSSLLGVPPLLMSLLILSLGTNIPELMIAIRSIKARHQEIAFGDYVGSAATNVLVFAVLTFIHGPFVLETRGFSPIFFIIIAGYAIFFMFSRIKNRISPAEGLGLILIYLVFLLFQTAEIVSLSKTI